MAFSDDVALRARDDGTYDGSTDPAYTNLIGPFGGWIAGVLLAGVLAEPHLEGDPISSSTTFAAAIADGPFVVRPERVRTNRSTEFWTSTIEQHAEDGQVRRATASIALAKRRPMRSFSVARAPEAPPPETLERIDPGRLGSAWLRKFDMRPVRGHPLVRRASAPRDDTVHSMVGWVREVEGTTLDFVTLTALCDTTFPQIFGLVRERVPISTIVMNCFFHVTSAELADIGSEYILSEATISIARDGFFDERTMLWSRDGRLVATTEQIVWYKAAVES